MRHPLRNCLVAAILFVGSFSGPASTGAAEPASRLDVTRTQLASGVRLVLSEQPAVPIVAIDCLVDGGARVDPKDRPGLAALTASLLEEGTQGRSAQDIAEIIDTLGGSFGSGSATDWISVSALVRARDFETGLDLVARSLREPTFPQDAVERRRAETLGSLRAAEDQPGYVAGRTFDATLFGDAPYGHPTQGTSASVTAITREEIEAYHQRWIVPGRTICAIVGDAPVARMLQVAKQKLGSWQAAEAPAEPAPAEPAAASIVLVDRPITQANIVVGHRGVDRKHPDFFAIRVLNHILGGGGFNSRLVDRVRDENGMAYSIYSRFGSNRLPGSFEVVLQTRAENASEALALVRAEIEGIHKEGALAEELSSAQDYLTGNFPLALDSTTKLAGLLAQIEYFGIGDDYIDTYADRIRAISLEDVQQAAKKHLAPEDLIVVVVGPQDELESQGLSDKRPNGSRTGRSTPKIP
jgi:zinc protease